MDLVKFILAHSDWLYTKLFQNTFFFFDLWSIVHIWSGFLLFLLLKSQKIKRAFLILAAILIFYEIFEILFFYFAFYIFKPETIQDQVTDIVVGIGGGILAYYFLRFAMYNSNTHRKTIFRIIILVASITYAFPWVGFYKYHYNTVWLNTPGINLTTLILWVIGGYITIQIFRSLKYRNPLVRLVVTWIFYIILLFGFEFTGYIILGVHEISTTGATPLLFGLIHGNRILHVFYLVSPLCTISLYSVFSWLFFKCVDLGRSELSVQKRTKLTWLITIDEKADLPEEKERKFNQ
jgi:uncharacterized membrane protein YeaQ/YmgE (transglycosylase-associated protein family)